MKHNLSVVPVLIKKVPQLSIKMIHGFLKMGLTKIKKRHTYGYNHMKNFCLIYLKLTPLCNLRCKMCGQRGDKGILKGEVGANEAKTILPLDTYKKLVDEIAPKKPVWYLWGGEPFLYPDLIPLVKYIIDKGCFCSVNTNGTLLEKYAHEIVRDKWSTLFVSLDAFRDVNDSIRGKGSYDKVIKGFEAINREKELQHSSLPLLGIVTTVTKDNFESLAELAEACKDYKIDYHVYNLGTYTNDEILAAHKQYMKEKLDTDIYALGAYNTGYNEGVDGKKLHDILTKIHSTDYGYISLTVPTLNPEKTHEYYHELSTHIRDNCIVPWCQCNINYNGDVTFCADYNEYVIGNIKEQTLKECYNSDKANKFREEILKCDGHIFPGCVRCYQNMLFGKKVKGY